MSLAFPYLFVIPPLSQKGMIHNRSVLCIPTYVGSVYNKCGGLLHHHLSKQNTLTQCSSDKTAEELFSPILWLTINGSQWLFVTFVIFASNRKLR